MTGRPSKRTPECERRILDALRAGNTRKAACAYAGIDLHTLARWSAAHATFATAIEKAEADAETRMVAQIAKAASGGTWTAAAWWLERRRSEEYGRRDKVDTNIELTGKDGGPIQSEDVTLNDHDRATRILAVLERARSRASRPADGEEPALGAAAGTTD